MSESLPVYSPRNCAPEMWPDHDYKENDSQKQPRAWVCSARHFTSTLQGLNGEGRWHPSTFSWKIFLASFDGDVAAGDSGRWAVGTKPFPSSSLCLSQGDFLVLKLGESRLTYISQHSTVLETEPWPGAAEPASPCFLLLAVRKCPAWPAGRTREQVFGTYVYQKWTVLCPKVTES